MAFHNFRRDPQSNLVAGSVIVPSGIVEIVRRQEQGWTYVKAGR